MTRPVHGGNLTWAASVTGCAPDELIDFSASISPLGVPSSISKELQAAFFRISAYPNPDYAELREAIAHHHTIPTNYILPGNGAAELLNWAARDLASLSRCYCLSPGFSDYDRALKAFGSSLSQLPLFDETLRYIDHWEKALANRDDLGRCGLLLNNPHNPTGALFSKERVESLLEQFALVVIDEAFMDFLPPEREQSVIKWVQDYPNLVVVRSLTKFYSIPGLRLGYAVAQPQTLQKWQQWRDAWPVNTLAAAAGVAALQDTNFQQQTWQWLNAENEYLFKAISEHPTLRPLPSCANFFLVRCAVSATELQEKLLKQHKLYIRDCISFQGLGDQFFRIAVKSREDNQKLLNGLADVLPTLLEVYDVG